MRSYNGFAQFYDCLTENVDYEVRSDYISNFFSEYGNGGKKLLDLACGTGSFSNIFEQKGFDVTGIDLSSDMLTIAKSKSPNISFVNADMTEFSFAEKFDFCICMLDSINHLTDIADVQKCFSCVYDSLNEDGLFIFDVNTLYKHSSILADNAFVFDEEKFFLSWDNEFDGADSVQIFLDIFVFNGKNYDRISESFSEKAYDISTLKDTLHGFDIIGIYDELTLDEQRDDSERLYFVCKKSKMKVE